MNLQDMKMKELIRKTRNKYISCIEIDEIEAELLRHYKELEEKQLRFAIESCNHGHKFVQLDGDKTKCLKCLVLGLSSLMEEKIELEKKVVWFQDKLSTAIEISDELRNALTSANRAVEAMENLLSFYDRKSGWSITKIISLLTDYKKEQLKKISEYFTLD